MNVLPYLALLRPFTLIYPFVAVFSGGMMSGIVSWRILLAALAASTMNGASNTINQYYDVDTDRINKPYRPIPSGRISRASAGAYGIILYLASIVMAWFAGFQFFAISLVAAVLTLAYSVPPARTKARGFLGNLTLSVTRGLVPLVAGWSVEGGLLNAEPWILGSILALFVFGANTSKDFSDVRGDRACKVRTIPVIYGNSSAARIMLPFLVFPFMLMPLFIWAGLIDILILPITLLSLWGLWVSRTLLKNPERLSLERNHPSWIHMYLMMTVFVIGAGLASLL